MTAEDWVDPAARSIALFIDGATDPDVGPDGKPMLDDDFLMFVNAWWEPLTFTIPADFSARQWSVVCDTYDPARKVTVGQALTVGSRSIVIVQSPSSSMSRSGDKAP
jgi:glycogen operon protein